MNKFILSVFLILPLLSGCRYCPDGKIEELLSRGEALADTKPDSALVLLDSIPFPENLGKGLFYRYVLLKTRAKDKSYRDISKDSLIFAAKEYFMENGEFGNLASATFYCGRVLQEGKKYSEALNQYLEADEGFGSLGDDTLRSLVQSQIGYVYYDRLLLVEARAHYMEAKRLMEADGCNKHKSLINSYIGNTFLLEGHTDSAMYYYNRGLDIAEKYTLADVRSTIMQNIGLTYQNKEDYRQAKKYYRRALSIGTNTANRARILYNIGYLTALQDKNDSASVYMNRALGTLTDTTLYFLRANIYKGLSVVYKNRKDYVHALEYTDRYASLIQEAFKDSRDKAVYDAERKYDNGRLKDRQSRLELQRQYIITAALSSVLALGCILSVMVRGKRKERRLREEAENSIIHLQDMASSFNEKENTFRNRLLKDFDILKKMALLKNILKEDEFKKEKAFLGKFNEIIYGQQKVDWDMLYDVMKELHGKFFKYLQKNHPSLNESEFRICSLIYTGFSNEEIGIIMNIAASSVTKKRSSIRKKLGINGYGSIRDFLKSRIK